MVFSMQETWGLAVLDVSFPLAVLANCSYSMVVSELCPAWESMEQGRGRCILPTCDISASSHLLL